MSRAGDGSVDGFAIAGDDRRFVWADAKIEGNRVVVWSDRVPSPSRFGTCGRTVRYAPVLYNREGLPVAPFRTDAW